MDLTPFIEKFFSFLSSILSSQPVQNAGYAVAGGLIAAIAFLRTTPGKLFCSMLLAGLSGFLFSGAACEIFMGSCTIEGYKAFSAGIGALSWPAFLILPQLPQLLARRISKK